MTLRPGGCTKRIFKQKRRSWRDIFARGSSAWWIFALCKTHRCDAGCCVLSWQPTIYPRCAIKNYDLISVLGYWTEGDSVLCLTDEDINMHSGCFMFNGTSYDKYWVYQGREQTGGYIFKYTSDYYRRRLIVPSNEGDEYFKRMRPAEAMKLKRRPFSCRHCWDMYNGGDGWNGVGGLGAEGQCYHCDPVCHFCERYDCVCGYLTGAGRLFVV